MHDDQHGTAIITSAALINALSICKKKIEKVKIVVNGAGASAISCAQLYVSLGAKKDNIVMVDSSGVIQNSRKDLSEQKKQFATSQKVNTLKDALKDADVFLGLSVADVVTKAMINSMAKKPIVFACANPDPEISYDEAMSARPDLIFATGRSDHPNQVNNVLGFPFIFRGALDVRATGINEEMKLAAVYAIAELAREPVPEIVNAAYDTKNMTFGPEYIIPKPLDPRLITWVAPAVAKAAIKSKVSQYTITDWEAYHQQLIERLGLDNKLIRVITSKAKRNVMRVVFAEADNYKILKAAQIVNDEGIAKPILLGNVEKITAMIEENNLDLKGVPIVDPRSKDEEATRHRFGDNLYDKRRRRGLTLYESRKLMQERNYFGASMVDTGSADVLISGLTRKYPDTIRPALQVIGVAEGVRRIAGMYIIITKKGPFFFADTTVTVNPSVQDLVDIAILSAETVKQFNLQPRIAMLSYSNFGSAEGEEVEKVRAAVEIMQEQYPGLILDGEVQANFALNKRLMKEQFPFTELADKSVNTLIFPNLTSGNIAYKLMQEMGGAEAIGPILLGMKKAVHVLQMGSSVHEIVNMVTIGAIDAQRKNR
jgi:malate dehydrogenase (oxaloacetate-decarboxylating)(NADP+)